VWFEDRIPAQIRLPYFARIFIENATPFLQSVNLKKILQARDTARLHQESMAWLKHELTQHDSTRTIVVNRLRRAGVPREAAMRLVNHASELIHQIYQREIVEDVAQWRDAVQFPA
jgi:hypothetical protein